MGHRTVGMRVDLLVRIDFRLGLVVRVCSLVLVC